MFQLTRSIGSATETPKVGDEPAATAQQSIARDAIEPPDIRSRIVLAAIVATVLWALYGPLVRSVMHVDINYNEGWNVYNATRALKHDLYPVKHGWTTVNYPFLSFFLIGHLARIFGHALFIGRLLSLIGLLFSSIAAYGIVRRLGGQRAPAFFAGAYFTWFILARLPSRVGMDDPQMLAQAVVLGALCFYCGRRSSANWRLPIIAFVFVLGLNIKQNLLAAPLAVLVDLFVESRARALRYASCGALFLVGAFVTNQWVGGPFFWAQFMTPREYSFRKIHYLLSANFSLAVPFCICAIWSFWSLRKPQYRAIALYFLFSFAIGLIFSGGLGTDMNVFCDSFMAISIIMGILLDSLWHSKIAGIHVGGRWKWAVPLLLWQVPCKAYPTVNRSVLRNEQNQFNAEVAYSKARPGPAICESLLRCYYAGKPYIYDPFNSTSLVQLGLLDPSPIVQKIENGEYGAIQIYDPVEKMDRPNISFPDEILDAIQKNYRVAIRDPHCVIYIPRQKPAKQRDPQGI